MRQFWDSTEVELAWARIFHENKDFKILFPESEEVAMKIRKSEEYLNHTNLFVAGYQTTVEYRDHRFNQERKIKLIVGVSNY